MTGLAAGSAVCRGGAAGRQLRRALSIKRLRRLRLGPKESMAESAVTSARPRRRRVIRRHARAGRRHPAHQLRDVRAAAEAQVVHEVHTRRPRRDGVDDGVPEPLQREHKRAHKLERHADLFLVDDGEDAVRARRDPGDEDGGEEEDGALGVRPRRVVDFVVAAAGRVRRARRAGSRLRRARGEAADVLGHGLGVGGLAGAALDGEADVAGGAGRGKRVGGDVDGVGAVAAAGVAVVGGGRLRADGGAAAEGLEV